MTSLRAAWLAVVVGASAGGAGCGPKTVVQLAPAPSPDLNSRAEVAGRVGRLALVVSSPTGLGEVGSGRALDYDGDGVLEAVFLSPPTLGGELPVLELGVGRAAGEVLGFRLLGLPGSDQQELDPVVALGSASAACPPEQVKRIDVPFNLRADARAPRVLMVLPPDGALGVSPLIKTVSVIFSTELSPGSFPGSFHLAVAGGQELPLSFTHQVFVVEGPREPERRSVVYLQLEAPLAERQQYTLRVEGVMSAGVRKLDYFESRFTTDVPTVGGGGSGCGYCLPGTVCMEALKLCVPENCGGACGPGFVCDTGSTQCVEDCRASGCSGSKPCDADSGFCR